MTNDAQQRRPIYSENTASVYFCVQLPEELLCPAPKSTPGVIKMQRGVNRSGHGLFAIRPVRHGEVIRGSAGRPLPADSNKAFVGKGGKFAHQVHPRGNEDADEISRIETINHSSKPNVGLSDAPPLVLMQHSVACKERPVELLMVAQ
ncbi:hypothetical protein NKH81_34320 [Mesorhizobium sp. M0959]|uniref:hypothetical protein n=1 Tax=Mesorhizobium sp. M0959 TaxID=2957034 RepID=UPI003335D2E2